MSEFVMIDINVGIVYSEVIDFMVEVDEVDLNCIINLLRGWGFGIDEMKICLDIMIKEGFEFLKEVENFKWVEVY